MANSLDFECFDCEYCCDDGDNSVKMQTLPDNVNDFLEFKALYKCWDVLCPAMLNYLSEEISMSSGLVRYLMNSLIDIEDPKEAKQVQTLLEQQISLHPPCRPGMHEFYLSVLYEPIYNRIFENSISENFFDFVKRVEEMKHVEKGTHHSGTSINTQKDVVQFLKRSIKPHISSKTTAESTDSIMHSCIFVFNTCLDILAHDFMAQLRSSAKQKPLLFKMVWDPFSDDTQVNLHVKDVFRLYANVSPDYRRDVGTYLVLLAEVIRRYDATADNEFPFYGDACSEFIESLGTRLLQNGSVTTVTTSLFKDIPSNWIKCQLFVCIFSNQLRSNVTKNRRKKKSLSISKR